MHKFNTLIIAVFLIVACGEQKVSSKEYFDKGMQFVQGGNSNGAIIALKKALENDDEDLLAHIGLAEIAQRQGQFALAEDSLRQTIAEHDLPVIHHRLGRLYAQQGLLDESIAEFDVARRGAPLVARFQVALADVCLNDGRKQCAELLFSTAADLQSWPDHASRLIAEADMWRQRGETKHALPLYEQAAQEQEQPV